MDRFRIGAALVLLLSLGVGAGGGCSGAPGYQSESSATSRIERVRKQLRSLEKQTRSAHENNEISEREHMVIREKLIPPAANALKSAETALSNNRPETALQRARIAQQFLAQIRAILGEPGT